MKKQVAPPPKPEGFDPETVAGKMKLWFKDLSPTTIDKLVLYQSEILKFNRSINLISSATEKNAESVHIGDSVLASRLIFPTLVAKQPVYDLGSGNGCPGVVFAILYPQIPVVLVDRDGRKMEFCKHVGAKLGLTNLTIQIKDVEAFEDGSMVNAISRGFAPFSRSLIVCRKLFAKGGRLFHMKADGWANELASMPSQVFTHWSPSLLGKYRLPESSVDMYVVLTERSS